MDTKVIYISKAGFYYITAEPEKAKKLAEKNGIDKSLADGFCLFADMNNDELVIVEAYDLHDNRCIEGDELKFFCSSLGLKTE